GHRHEPAVPGRSHAPGFQRRVGRRPGPPWDPGRPGAEASRRPVEQQPGRALAADPQCPLYRRHGPCGVLPRGPGQARRPPPTGPTFGDVAPLTFDTPARPGQGETREVMRVTQLQAYQVHIPLKRPFRHASHTRTGTDNVVVRCTLEDGTAGWGEGVPREYVTGETIDSAMDLLARNELKAQLSPCPDFKAAVTLAECLRLAAVPRGQRGCQGNGARCAVEMALLDAYGRRFGQPLSAVVALLAPELAEPKPRVQYSGAITTSSTGLKIKALALGMRLYGFRHIKVKVGVAGHDDVARLRAVRRRSGAAMDLRVDANEAW